MIGVYHVKKMSQKKQKSSIWLINVHEHGFTIARPAGQTDIWAMLHH